MCVKSFLRPRLFSVVVVGLALLLPVVAGCGGRKAKVTGYVTLDGKPLPAGTIVFHPGKGNPVSGEITDGQYTITNAPTGELQVTVDTAYLKQQIEAMGQATQNMGMSMGDRAPGSIPPEAREALAKEKERSQESAQKAKELQARFRSIPAKYTKTESSGFTTRLRAGTNKFDVDLSSK